MRPLYSIKDSKTNLPWRPGGKTELHLKKNILHLQQQDISLDNDFIVDASVSQQINMEQRYSILALFTTPMNCIKKRNIRDPTKGSFKKHRITLYYEYTSYKVSLLYLNIVKRKHADFARSEH